ncbi:MAG: NADH-dependent [FeFe] hydrogenase, group A6 [candidate division WOR-3 bacterium]
MVKELTVFIDGIEVKVPEGTTILDAAKKINVDIPTLCYYKDLTPTGNCGICVVEVENTPTLKRACCTPVADKMKIKTNTKQVIDARKTVLELILSNHPNDCLECFRNQSCELQAMAEKLGVYELPFKRFDRDMPLDDKGVIIRDPNKCILCGRCIQVCQNIQTVFAIDFINRGYETKMAPFMDMPLSDSVCTNCGQCVVVCPVGALYEKSSIDDVWAAINDPTKHVVVQEAPAVRVAIGEEFGFKEGEVTAGKMHAVLRRMGFDRVFDTNFTADLTIMEEGTEVVHKIYEAFETGNFGKHLPVITSCSPGWIKFMETFFADLREHISSAKSPQQMFGALAKTYYAKMENIDPKDIVSVSIMPCTAKKYEAARPEMNASGFRDVDYVLTTREFAKMIRQSGIDFKNLPDEPADELMGFYTGAATIFGATGGVMEAAIRTAYFVLSGEEMKDYDIKIVRGMEGIKEGVLEVPVKKLGKKVPLKVAVAHGLGNARKLLTKVAQQLKEKGESEYHFIEIMACPGGCVGGGGQPYACEYAARARRAEGLYKEDKEMLQFRASHQNPMVQKAYKEFLGEPYSHLAHKLLHTKYVDRSDLV